MTAKRLTTSIIVNVRQSLTSIANDLDVDVNNINLSMKDSS